MGLDLRTQLAALDSSLNHRLLFYACGSEHPPYNSLCLKQSLELFCRDFVPRCPLFDPRGKRVVIKRTNFPKLINIARHSKDEDRGVAWKLLETIERDDFDETVFRGDFKWETDRIRTLFWVPEVICDPDAIYRNGHTIIQGDEVYVRVYNKSGSKVKLLFAGGKTEQRDRFVVTSFLTNPQDASDYVRGKPLYVRPQKQ